MRVRLWLYLFGVFLSLYSPYVHAQEPYFNSVELSFLGPNDRVNAILQASAHYIYIGTSRGLRQYDGNSFRHIPSPNGIHEITAIFQDNSGTIWTGTKDGGLYVVDEDSLKIPTRSSNLLIDKPITGIVEDKNLNIWISTYGDGIWILDQVGSRHLGSKDGLPDTYIYCILSLPSEEILVGTDAGIGVITSINELTPSINIISSTQGLPDNIVLSMAAAEDGSVWIGTQSKGIAQLKKDKYSFYKPQISDDWELGVVTSMLVVEKELWVGTDRHGIVKFGFDGEESVQSYEVSNGKSPRSVKTMLQDNEGNIWIAGNGNALHRTNRQFTFIQNHEGVSFQNINAITGDRMGNVWFSNSNGLYRHNIVFNGNHTIDRPLQNTRYFGFSFISLFEDSDGFIWAGTFDHGVLCIDPRTGKVLQYDHQSGLADDNVIAIGQRKDEIWLATLGGVSRLTNLKSGNVSIKTFGKNDGLGNSYVFDIKADSKDRIWFATDGSGLTMYDGQEFYNYSDQMDSLSRVVYSIVEDGSGTIWFSTPKSGLYNFDGNTFNSYTSSNGLLSSQVVGLAVDKHGDILSIHTDGIDVINIKRNQIVTYGSAYGIKSINPQIKAIATDSKGNVWIGTEENIILFEPSDRVTPSFPKVDIQSVDLFLEPISIAALSKLNHRQNHLTFRYVGMWFQNPKEVHYRYKLEGYNRDWITTGDRSTTFSSLAPGDYVFKLQASHSNNFDGLTEQKVAFTILQPFWTRLWFIGLLVLLIVGILLVAIRLREQRINLKQRTQREKLAFQLETLRSQVNPHFLFNSFNTLIYLIEQDPKKSVKYVEHLSQFFRDILQYRDANIIPVKEELELSNSYLFLQRQRFHDNLRVRIDVSDESKEKLIPPMTVQILLENAVKHNVITKDKPLLVEIYDDDGYLCVKNVLQTKHTGEPSTKLGLENIRNRFSLLSSKHVLIIEDDAYFCVRVPLIETEI